MRVVGRGGSLFSALVLGLSLRLDFLLGSLVLRSPLRDLSRPLRREDWLLSCRDDFLERARLFLLYGDSCLRRDFSRRAGGDRLDRRLGLARRLSDLSRRALPGRSRLCTLCRVFLALLDSESESLDLRRFSDFFSRGRDVDGGRLAFLLSASCCMISACSACTLNISLYCSVRLVISRSSLSACSLASWAAKASERIRAAAC